MVFENLKQLENRSKLLRGLLPSSTGINPVSGAFYAFLMAKSTSIQSTDSRSKLAHDLQLKTRIKRYKSKKT